MRRYPLADTNLLYSILSYSFIICSHSTSSCFGCENPHAAHHQTIQRWSGGTSIWAEPVQPKARRPTRVSRGEWEIVVVFCFVIRLYCRLFCSATSSERVERRVGPLSNGCRWTLPNRRRNQNQRETYRTAPLSACSAGTRCTRSTRCVDMNEIRVSWA